MIPIAVRSIGHDRTEVAFGEGGEHGYVNVVLWSLSGEEREIDGLLDRSNARRAALTARVAIVMQADPECQAILEAEKAERRRMK